RRHRLRHLPHPGVLRPAACAHRQPPVAAPRRIHRRRRIDRSRAVRTDRKGAAVKKRDLSLILVLLAGCATSLPEIAPEKLPEPPPAEFKGRFTLATPAEA